MANEFKVNAAGGLRLPVLASDPSSPADGTIWYNSTTGTVKKRENGVTTEVAGGEFSDSVFTVYDNTDGTKEMVFEVSAIATGTTRTVTMPDSNVNLGQIATNQSNFSAHTDGGASKHDATEVDYERVDGSKKDIQAASDDVETALTDLDDNKISKTGSIAFTGNQSMGGNKITNLGTPTVTTDAATKAYVDAIKTGLDVKDSVRAASTANVALTGGATLTVDGVVLVNNDRILLKDQTVGTQNGIYDVSGIGTAYSLTRSDDADTSAEVTPGLFTFVEEGTANSDTGWLLITDAPIVLGTTVLSFTQFSGAGQITAGNALTKTGNTLDVNVDDVTIEISSDALRAKDNGISNAKLSDMAAWTLKVRNAGTSGDPSDAAAADITTKASPASGDFVVGFDSAASSAIKKFDVNALPVSSATQSALDGKASITLNNLGSTAINTSLISDTDNTDDLGSQAINWKDVHAKSLKSTNGLTTDADSDAVGDRGSDHTMLAKAVKRGKQAGSLVEEEYFDSLALTDNNTAVLASFTFAHASYNAIQVEYLIREATSLKTRVGNLMIVTDGTTTSMTDTMTEVNDPGVTWSAAVSGANVQISYTTTSTGNARTMRADLKRFRAI